MSLPHLRRIPLHSPTVSSRRGRSTGLRCPWSNCRLWRTSPLLPFQRHQSDRKSTRLNSSHLVISYAVFCLKKKKNTSLSPDSLHYRIRLCFTLPLSHQTPLSALLTYV